MKNIKVLLKDKEGFPEILKNIKRCPKQLYAVGNLKLLDTDIVAIVGSRKPSEYGNKVAREFTQYIAKRNVTIISGMALGIDTIAHETTINITGKTIAVLGSGFNNIYPSENTLLFEKILNNNGLIISEYSPNVKESANNFTKRNRIISGLALRSFDSRSGI